MAAVAPPPPKPPARVLPKFCSYCRRELVVHREFDLYDSRTGEEVWSTWLACPRFPRSWRNLWFGGLMHDCVSADPHCWLEQRWM